METIQGLMIAIIIIVNSIIIMTINHNYIVAMAMHTSASQSTSGQTITATITRKLAFPDFRDDEKVGAMVLLGNAGIDKDSGSLKIPGENFNPNNNTGGASMFSGRALYSFPFRMMDPATKTTASFRTTFSFQMLKAAAAVPSTSSGNSSANGSGKLTQKGNIGRKLKSQGKEVSGDVSDHLRDYESGSRLKSDIKYDTSPKSNNPIESNPIRSHISHAFLNKVTFLKNINKNNHQPSSHGLTFVVVPDELTLGSPKTRDKSHDVEASNTHACDDEDLMPFAVQIDTLNMEKDRASNHRVGIHYWSSAKNQGIYTNKVAKLPLLGNESASEVVTRAWITYDSSKCVVEVRLARDGDPKPHFPLLSASIDLSLAFKEYMFVGFSSASSKESISSTTHSLNSSLLNTPSIASLSTHLHYNILSWHFSSDTTGILRFPKHQVCSTNHSSPKIRTVTSPFIIFCLIILVIALAIINLVASLPRQNNEYSSSSPLTKFRLQRHKQGNIHFPKKFSLHEILDATKIFNEAHILGFSRHGTFYKGDLNGVSQVVIKRLSSTYLKHQQHEKDIKTKHYNKKLEKEIHKFTNVHHPNLLPIKGWCFDKGEVLLVYEYMPNGSLDQWLFSSDSSSSLPWIRRYKIIKELASAIACLHSSSKKPIVHKNVKLSNVFLDITFRAQLGDYSLFQKLEVHQDDSNPILSKMLQRTFKRENNQVMCLRPCQSIEMKQVRVTSNMDVYCYGMLVLQIVSRRITGKGENDLVEWVWSLYTTGNLLEAIDVNLMGGSAYYNLQEDATIALTVGLLCTMQEPSKRPSMTMVLKYLNHESPTPKLMS